MYAITKLSQWVFTNCTFSQIRRRLKNSEAIAPYIPPIKNSLERLLSLIVSKTYDTAKTIGIPPIAPAILAPENLAIIRMTAVTPAEARLLIKISIYYLINFSIIFSTSSALAKGSFFCNCFAICFLFTSSSNNSLTTLAR